MELLRFLEQVGIRAKIIPLVNIKNDEDLSRIVKVDLFMDNLGYLKICYPKNAKLNLDRLRRYLKRNISLSSEYRKNRDFVGTDTDYISPFDNDFVCLRVIDSSVYKFSKILVPINSHELVELDSDFFCSHTTTAKKLPIQKTQKQNKDTKNSILQTSTIDKIPKIPNVAKRILDIALTGGDNKEILCNLFEENQAVTNSIINFARKLDRGIDTDSIHDIADRLDDFELVSHVALSFCATESLFQNKNYDLALNNFWKHSFLGALLSKDIGVEVAKKDKIDLSILPICALVHNFGMLVMRSLYYPEYKLLDSWIRKYPNKTVPLLEQRLLGLGRAMNVVSKGHASLGAWLLSEWNFPDIVSVVAKNHHVIDYSGPYEQYVAIVQLSNALLRDENIGDGNKNELPKKYLDKIGFELDDAILIKDRFLTKNDTISLVELTK